MAKEKAHEVIREVKEHSNSAIKDKASQVGIKVKENSKKQIDESINNKPNQNNEQTSPENYATDKVTDTAERATEVVTEKGVKAVKKAGKRAREKVDEKRKSKIQGNVEPEESPVESNDVPKLTESTSQSEQAENINNTELSESTKTETKKAEKNNPEKRKEGSAKEKQNLPENNTTEQKSDKTSKNGDLKSNETEQKNSSAKTKSDSKSQEPPRKAPKQKEKSPPKTRGQKDIKSINSAEKEIKTVNNGGHKIKQTKSSIENTSKTIKTADHTLKNAEKTAKSSKKAAETTAKTAKKAEETTKQIVKSTEKAVKAVAKAVVEGGKALVAAGKDLVALIGSGGATVVIIIIICLLAAVGGTCFGIFLSNDKTTGSKMTMTEAITTLTSEYYADLTAMKTSYTYDEMDVNSLTGDTNLNWKDILAVYAVKNTTSKGDGFEVVTLDDKKLDVLRGIMKDMSKMTGVVTPKVVAETSYTYDESGNPISTTKYVTKKVLTISVVKLSADEISKIYKFNDEQTKQLKELMSDEYADLWAEIIGASGDIIVSDSTYTPKDMFTWPLSINGTITSRFGTRVDPISGVVKTHGGTDIAAPTGTPILAAADGTVLAATYNAGGYGFYVKLQHAGGYQTIYGHCSVLHVTAGQTVKQGQLIADVGSTGYSTGPHCHFEVIQNGVRVDALRFFN